MKDSIKIKVIVEKFNTNLNNKKTDIKSNLIKMKSFIKEIYGEYSDELANCIIILLEEQYKKVDDKNYKFEILKFIFENGRLIQKSLYFIHQTIKINYSIEGNNKNNFLNFMTLKKADKIYYFYENIKSGIFDQILLYYFELLANDYFSGIFNESKESDNQFNKLLFKNNIIFLKEALTHIDNVFMNKNLEEDSLNNIGKIYSIAYIKLYIKHFAEIYRYNKGKIDYKKIIEVISSKDYNTRNVIKYFFFKNIFLFFDNYSQFHDYILNDPDFPFKNFYENNFEKQKSKDISILKYPFTANIG